MMWIKKKPIYLETGTCLHGASHYMIVQNVTHEEKCFLCVCVFFKFVRLYMIVKCVYLLLE